MEGSPCEEEEEEGSTEEASAASMPPVAVPGLGASLLRGVADDRGDAEDVLDAVVGPCGEGEDPAAVAVAAGAGQDEAAWACRTAGKSCPGEEEAEALAGSLRAEASTFSGCRAFPERSVEVAVESENANVNANARDGASGVAVGCVATGESFFLRHQERHHWSMLLEWQPWAGALVVVAAAAAAADAGPDVAAAVAAAVDALAVPVPAVPALVELAAAVEAYLDPRATARAVAGSPSLAGAPSPFAAARAGPLRMLAPGPPVAAWQPAGPPWPLPPV